MLPTALHYSHQLLKEVVQINDSVVDATMGNGYDTLFLAEQVGENGRVLSFDLQEKAIETTKERLVKANLENRVTLIQDGHENFTSHVAKDLMIKAAIFNLGYLPNSDKKIITKSNTTLLAIEQLLTRLLPNGRLIIVAYYGHEGGPEELEQVTNFCQKLPQECFQVLTYQFINQRNQPPILFCIEKKKTN